MNSNNNKKRKLGKKLKEPSLLLRIEQIKYRKPGPGKSPLGTIFIFEDRIEWTNDSDKADQLLVNFSKIKAQRISPPNKAKVQLQLCLLNDDQATFVFMNPAHSQEELVQERDLMKETLQQALVQHRQIVNQLAQKAARGGTDKEQEEKIRILEQNAYLHDLYLHLVKEKLITAQDFWSFHYKPDEKLDKNKEKEEDSNGRQRVGISGGFLSSIVQSEGIGGGIRLNLTNETIQSIFRTYPAVERKHLELVPHEMTEQDFWSRFFQSHYFHRERNPAEPSTSAQSQQNDPFADCVQMDEKDMRGIIEKSQRTLKRHLDLTYINEDLGILSEMRSAQISVRGSSEAKKLLVRRCNYHSERVLSTMELEENYNKNEVAINSAENGTNGSTENTLENGSSSKNGKRLHETKSNEGVLSFDLDLESQELAEIDGTGQEYTPFSAYNPPTISGQERSAEQIQRAKNALEEVLAASDSVLEEKSQIDFFNNLATNSLDSEESDEGTEENGLNSATRFEGLARIDVERIRIVHSCLAELLRHFWHCFPPNSPEMENKIHRMDETLTKFEQNQLAECEKKYGSIYVQHCREMLALARQRYQAFNKAAQQRR